MSLEKEINNILNKIQRQHKQLNFESPAARKHIAETIAQHLDDKPKKSQRRQSDAGSLIF